MAAVTQERSVTLAAQSVAECEERIYFLTILMSLAVGAPEGAQTDGSVFLKGKFLYYMQITQQPNAVIRIPFLPF